MKLNQRMVKLSERMANKYRHRYLNGSKGGNDLHLSKAKHPSRARSIHGANAYLEARNDHRMAE